MKTGRNQPCPCGSGIKFKRCHGAQDRRHDNAPMSDAIPPEVLRELARRQALETRRRQQQGMGRPIISGVVKGHRVVAVGNRIYASDKVQTFHDFLRDYIPYVFGTEWVRAEREKPAELQHPVMRWALQSFDDYRRTAEEVDGFLSAPVNGAMYSLLGLSYNLYLAAHNVSLQKVLIDRLKHPRAFWGALYETYVAAAFIKAGFDIEFENETDSSSTHCEFITTHRQSGKRFSVEAKARDAESQAKRMETFGTSDRLNFGLGGRLHSALRKRADHPRIVFIELSLPLSITPENKDTMIETITAEVAEKEITLTIAGAPAPPAYLFVTNHPFHHRLDELVGGPEMVVLGFKIPNFGYGFSFSDFRDYVTSCEEHAPVLELAESIRSHHEIPSTFDGEMPELVFSRQKDAPRLEIGRTYLVPTNGGKEVPAVLEQALMIELEKHAYGVFSTGENFILATCPVTDEELEAYKQYPDTFFGAPTQKPRKSDDPISLFDFMYETYVHTPRAKLLEFMRHWVDIEELRTLSQKDLAIKYCERHTWGLVQEREKQEAAAAIKRAANPVSDQPG